MFCCARSNPPTAGSKEEIGHEDMSMKLWRVHHAFNWDSTSLKAREISMCYTSDIGSRNINELLRLHCIMPWPAKKRKSN